MYAANQSTAQMSDVFYANRKNIGIQVAECCPTALAQTCCNKIMGNNADGDYSTKLFAR